MANPVVWFEVLGKNTNGLRSFYTQLFDWKLERDKLMDYSMVAADEGRGIPGGVGLHREPNQPKVTFYVSTPDISASLKQAETLGGQTLMPRTKLPGGTVLGMFADPEGNAIGLVEEEAA